LYSHLHQSPSKCWVRGVADHWQAFNLFVFCSNRTSVYWWAQTAQLLPEAVEEAMQGTQGAEKETSQKGQKYSILATPLPVMCYVGNVPSWSHLTR